MQLGKNSILLLVPLLFLLSGCEKEGSNGVVSLLTGGSGVNGNGYTEELIVANDPPGPLGPPIRVDGEDGNTIVNPEPGSLLLFGTGLVGSALSRSKLRRFFKKKA